MKDKEIKSMIKKAGEEGARRAQKIKTLEYKMNFGTVTATIAMSLN